MQTGLTDTLKTSYNHEDDHMHSKKMDHRADGTGCDESEEISSMQCTKDARHVEL